MGGLAAVYGPFPGDDDPGLDGHFAWLVRELDAGRVSRRRSRRWTARRSRSAWATPVTWTRSCWRRCAVLTGSAGRRSARRSARTRRPTPCVLARSWLPLTAQAVASAGSLTDNELIGALQAGLRLANLADYQQTVVIAEFARRRQAEFESARARGVPVGCRDGEFPGEELAMELVDTGACTGARIDAAIELTARLPRTLAGMADGTIDLARACTIASRTRAMDDAAAAYADEVLAEAAPGLRPDQLARKAAALEMRLAPEAVRARKELAKRLGPAGRGPPRGIRQRFPGRPRAGYRRRDRLQGPHRRDRAQAPRLRPHRRHPRHAPRPGAGRPHPGP